MASLRTKRSSFLSVFSLALLLSALASPNPPGAVGESNSKVSGKPYSAQRKLHTGDTADEQSNSSSALDLTRRIRQALVEREDLSTAGRNIKIISSGNGSVSLQGPVKTRSERELIGRIAMDIAGDRAVKNGLVVGPVTESRKKS